MRPIHLLAILLCVSFGLADAILAVHLESATSAVFLLLAGMAFGQLALLAIWSVLGTGPWLLRVLAAPPVAVGLAAPLASVTAASWSGWFVALGSYWLIVTLVLNRWQAGRRRATSIESSGSDSGAAKPGRFQFSLGSLLSAITLISVALGMGPWVGRAWPHLLAFAPVGIWLVTVAVVTLHGTEAEHRAWVAAPVIVAIVGGTLLTRITGLHDTGFFTLLCLVEALTIAVGMTIVHSAGASTSADLKGPLGSDTAWHGE